MSNDRNSTPLEAGVVIALSVIVVAVCAALLLAVIGTGAPDPSPDEAAVQQHRTGQLGPAERRPVDVVPAPTPYEPRCSPAYSKDEDDLCQQRRMAKAAEQSAYWAFWQVVVSGIAGALILPALWFAAHSARAASDAAKAAIGTVNAQVHAERARLHIDDPGTRRLETFATLGTTVSNRGRTAADLIGNIMECHATTTLPQRKFGAGELASLSGKVLEPGASFRIDLDPKSKERIQAMKPLPRSVFVIGCVDYETVFQKRYRRGFAYRVNPITGKSQRTGGPAYNYDRELQDEE